MSDDKQEFSPSSRRSSGKTAAEEFKGAGEKVGLQVWRIEKMAPVEWKDLGQFYSGDSYICLNTIEPRAKMDLFFWLGEKSSADEKGACAYKTVELDQLLGDIPIQYREVQGHESGQFLSLWKSYGGIRYSNCDRLLLLISEY